MGWLAEGKEGFKPPETGFETGSRSLEGRQQPWHGVGNFLVLRWRVRL